MLSFDIEKELHGSEGTVQLRANLAVAKGETLALFGPSGAGKTTILRMLAGLVSPDQGSISFENEQWFDRASSENIIPGRRNVGFVFQDYALFPNMSVLENIQFAQQEKDRERIDELMNVMQLDSLRDKRPQQLSGGQKQRVALARVFAQRPHLLLLDEPFSSLDDQLKRRLWQFLSTQQKELAFTTILVSHDIAEIVQLAHQVAILKSGKVIQKGNPVEEFANTKMSGKFQFIAQVLNVDQQDFLHILTLLVGHEIVRVVANDQEASQLKKGDRVLVASKGFNPVVRKIE